MCTWFIELLLFTQVAGNRVYLSQNDFANGTVLISSPGDYVLTEDIVFEPRLHCFVEKDCDKTLDWIINQEDPSKKLELLFHPHYLPENDKYSSRSFTLGFFTAISIDTTGVNIDLNGFTIRQGYIHSLMQRFFALITLSNSPFPANAGPADFADDSTFQYGQQIVIENGTLGLSSHHGIHGNFCEDVILRDLKIENFEVAGISLNSAKRVLIERTRVINSRRDVPVSGRFSQAIFSLQAKSLHLDSFKSLSLFTSLPSYKNLDAATKSLRHDIICAIAFILNKIPQPNLKCTATSTWKSLLISQTRGLPDGSLLSGIIIHPKFNVDDFFDNATVTNVTSPNGLKETSNDIRFSNVSIANLSHSAVESTALTMVVNGSTISVSDSFGSIIDLDIIRGLDDNRYISNSLVNLQLAMAEFKFEVEKYCLGKGYDQSYQDDVEFQHFVRFLSRSNIPRNFLKWSKNEIEFETMLENNSIPQLEFVAKRDVMYHVIKGLIGIKVDGNTNLVLDHVTVENLENHATRDQTSYMYRGDSLHSRVFTTKGICFSSDVNAVGRLSVSSLQSVVNGVPIVPLDFMHNNDNIGVRLNYSQTTSGIHLQGTYDSENNKPLIEFDANKMYNLGTCKQTTSYIWVVTATFVPILSIFIVLCVVTKRNQDTHGIEKL